MEVIDRRQLYSNTKNTILEHRKQQCEEASRRTDALHKNLIIRLLVQVYKQTEFWRPALLITCPRRRLEWRWQRATHQQYGVVVGYVFSLANKRSNAPIYTTTKEDKDEESTHKEIVIIIASSVTSNL